jgi:hypothetical protein
MRPTNYPFYSTTQSVFGVFAIKGCIRCKRQEDSGSPHAMRNELTASEHHNKKEISNEKETHPTLEIRGLSRYDTQAVRRGSNLSS